MNLVNRFLGSAAPAPAPLENDQKGDDDQPIGFIQRQKIINSNQDEANAHFDTELESQAERISRLEAEVKRNRHDDPTEESSSHEDVFADSEEDEIESI